MLEWVVRIAVGALLAMVAVATLVPEADRAAAIGDARDRVVERVTDAFTQGQDERMAVYDDLAAEAEATHGG